MNKVTVTVTNVGLSSTEKATIKVLIQGNYGSNQSDEQSDMNVGRNMVSAGQSLSCVNTYKLSNRNKICAD